MAKYYQGTYAADHWAMQDPAPPGFLFEQWCTADTAFVAYLNPTDSRGCRAIVRLACREEPALVVNRPFTDQECAQLAAATEQLAAAYRKVFPIVQTMVLGNNAHSLDADRQVVLGSAAEPFMLHAHIVARGDPLACYVPGVPLGGPAPGEQFDMRQKVPWAEGAMAKCAEHIKKCKHQQDK